MLRFVKLNILKILYCGLKDIRELLKRLYCSLKFVRIPNIKGTLFYIKINNFLLILLFSIAKQLLIFTSRVDRFNKKLLNLFSVLNKTIIPL